MTELLNKVKISQWDALLLESLRGRGWSDEQLLGITTAAELPVDDSVFEFDYRQLQATAEAQPEEFGQAVTSGYQIKYNTLRGIRSWIVVALGKEAQLVLEEGQEAVEVALTEAEKDRLEQVLSYGWRIVLLPAADPDSAQYRIEPIQR
jgi:hypothetical protein